MQQVYTSNAQGPIEWFYGQPYQIGPGGRTPLEYGGPRTLNKILNFRETGLTVVRFSEELDKMSTLEKIETLTVMEVAAQKTVATTPGFTTQEKVIIGVGVGTVVLLLWIHAMSYK